MGIKKPHSREAAISNDLIAAIAAEISIIPQTPG
jgi:hypothetical protein